MSTPNLAIYRQAAFGQPFGMGKKYFPYTVSMTREERANVQPLIERSGLPTWSAYVRWLIDEDKKREPTRVVRMTEEQFRVFQEAISAKAGLAYPDSVASQRAEKRKHQ